MTILKKKISGSYTGAYLSGKGRKLSTKAARLNVTIAAFVLKFVNSHVRRTHYFRQEILESMKAGHAERVLRPFKDSIRNDALISVPIGVIDAMISRHLDEIKNVLHEVRTNPQAA